LAKEMAAPDVDKRCQTPLKGSDSSRLPGIALLWQIFAADERDGIPKSVFQ
jgi:hypothetical protein